MKSFVSTILLCLIMICTINPCYAYPNEQDGFRGIPWGTSYESVKGQLVFREHAHDCGGIDYYNRINDPMIFGAAQLTDLVYGFWHGKFCTVILATPESNSEAMLSALQLRFEQGKQSDRAPGYYFWPGNETFITYSTTLQAGETIVSMESTLINKEIDNWQAQERTVN